ncbi:MAG: hypothetical protein EOO41_05350, partial [Methanobacteriota archaeon]
MQVVQLGAEAREMFGKLLAAWRADPFGSYEGLQVARSLQAQVRSVPDAGGSDFAAELAVLCEQGVQEEEEEAAATALMQAGWPAHEVEDAVAIARAQVETEQLCT